MSGSPEGLEIERKFLLADAPATADLWAHGAKSEELIQHYLVSAPGEPLRRLRIIKADGKTRYLYTEKRGRGGIVREEHERPIGEAEAEHLLAQADRTRGTIHKTRWTWLEGGQTWELDIFKSPAGLVLLEAEVADAHVAVRPPVWLGELTDVSEDPAYQNAGIARALAQRR